ncbi:hypothetical protein G7046_g2175 [Stylonectria norvegica]|nr:hypothetical protein G7046_g2175 [Stylonectria norvegica]
MASTLLMLAFAVTAFAANGKRGLCAVSSTDNPSDDKIWIQPGTDLTWYYNYQELPSPAYSSLSQEAFEFVPMMWGVGANPEDTTFYDTVKKLIEEGTNISHVLGFNEPNAPASWGGSNVIPETAAQAWVANFEPLGKMGVKLGLPACTGGFPGAEIWVTEFAYANQDPAPTEEFYNETINYFDKESWLGRYTWFGAFRSSVSNILALTFGLIIVALLVGICFFGYIGQHRLRRQRYKEEQMNKAESSVAGLNTVHNWLWEGREGRAQETKEENGIEMNLAMKEGESSTSKAIGEFRIPRKPVSATGRERENPAMPVG